MPGNTFLPGTAHVELAAGPTPPFPLLPGPRQRRQPIRHLSSLEPGALEGPCRSFWRDPGRSLRPGRSLPLSGVQGSGRETTTDTINPNNQPSVKAGQVYDEPWDSANPLETRLISVRHKRPADMPLPGRPKTRAWTARRTNAWFQRCPASSRTDRPARPGSSGFAGSTVGVVGWRIS